MKFLPLILIAGLTGLSLPSTAAASPEKGLEIATELDKRDTGFKDSTSTMVMVLSDQHGQIHPTRDQKPNFRRVQRGRFIAGYI